MELADFLAQTQAQVRTQIEERVGSPPYPYPECVFTEVVMEHLAEHGMTANPVVCHFITKVGNARLKVSGYALSDDGDQLDLFVSLYEGLDDLQPITDTDTKAAAEQCLRFLTNSASGRLVKQIDESNEAYNLAQTIQTIYPGLEQIRVYVLTDRVAKAKNFKPRDERGKTIKLEVVDIQRLYRHWSEGRPRDELVVNFDEICGSPLPSVFVLGDGSDYDCVLTAIPGEALRFVYEKFGARLLEANVRSFLSVTGKVNRGIRDTLREDPERFMAYNNGVVLVADEHGIGKCSDGAPGLVWLKGMQIVNGGQTTASIYFTKKREPEVDLARVRVPAKIIILKSRDVVDEEVLIADISRCANSQNSVKQSDLSANKPFHIELEKLSASTYCPDGVGRWFYERAAGSYNTMLAREGTTAAKLKRLRTILVPPSRKITKTELAKYLNAWDQKPDSVSFGSQKNFERFMEWSQVEGGESRAQLVPDAAFFKASVAKAIVFKQAQSLVRPMFPAFQANVATYLVSVLAHRLGGRFDLNRVWQHQDISPALRKQLGIWAHEVSGALHKSAHGKMVSEWAKKPECWEYVRATSYTPVATGIPELR